MLQPQVRGVAVVPKGRREDAVDIVVRQVEDGHVFAVPEHVIAHVLYEVVAHVDGGQVDVLEGLTLHLRNLVFREVNGVDKPQVGKHLKLDFSQLIPSQVDSTNPKA